MQPDPAAPRPLSRPSRSVAVRLGPTAAGGAARPLSPMTDPTQATVLLRRLNHGDRAAADELLPLVYDELHRLAERFMGGERSAHTLQPTALVHEAYLRLVDGAGDDWEDRRHFLGVAARAMRNVLVDHARTRGALKRGGDYERVPLDDALALYEDRVPDMLSLDEALQQLERLDDQLGSIVELRFFGGLSNVEAGKVLGVSTRSVERGWSTARAWLRAALAT